MINSVRNTVLSVLNKNNYGYISPSDFNLFAKQAQLEIFEEYFSQYNTALNKENARISGVDYANMTKGIEESIDIFSVTKALPQNVDNVFYVPSLDQTNDDYFLLNKVLCYAPGVAPGVAGAFTGEADAVSHSRITMLVNSNLTAPTASFPAYTVEGNFLTVYPDSINQAGQVQAQYIRYPFDPKWTYITLANGEPVFNPDPTDYQDFELPIDDEPRLVNRILQMSGMSIRELQVVQYANNEEAKNSQAQS